MEILAEQEKKPFQEKAPLSFKNQRWMLPNLDPLSLTRLEQKNNLSAIMARLLTLRCPDPDEIEDFLNPQLRRLMPDPSCLQDMDKAVTRLIQALDNQESIALFGDYDVDGACSSALFAGYWRKIKGKEIHIHIPDRFKEGYGPNKKAFEGFKKKHIDLIVTVDCGISAYDSIETACLLGMDVIVVDHHMAPQTLPPALCIVNPNRLDDTSKLGHLAAAGVVFMLLVALQRRLREKGFFDIHEEPDLKEYLDLVGLATICDVVPLVGLNRAFVRQGLHIMERSRHIGLKALCDQAGLSAPFSVYDMGFVLGPRLNAAGRLGKSDLPTALLLARTKEEKGTIDVFDLASTLHDLNHQRRDIEERLYRESCEMVDCFSDLPPILYLAKEGWHWGVMGIVASRLVRRYQRPVCVAGFQDGLGRGSGRSIKGVDLGALIIQAQQEGLLISGGGHPMAAGFAVDVAHEKNFQKFLEESIKDPLPSPTLAIDALLSPSALSVAFHNHLDALQPFGSNNPTPRFVLSNMHLRHARRFGDDRHVRVFLENATGQKCEGVVFNAFETGFGQQLESMKNGHAFHLAGKIKLSRYQGQEKIQFDIEDAAPHTMKLML